MYLINIEHYPQKKFLFVEHAKYRWHMEDTLIRKT